MLLPFAAASRAHRAKERGCSPCSGIRGAEEGSRASLMVKKAGKGMNVFGQLFFILPARRPFSLKLPGEGKK
jgi:hypothetical protein